MAIPRAVEAAERRANELHAKAYTTEAPQGTETPAATPNATPAATPAPTPAPAKPETEETWEVRYKTLAGKYNAEVPRLKQANDALQAQLDKAAQQHSDVTARLTALEKERSATPLVKPEEIESFGEPLVDLMRRVSREEAGRLLPTVNTDEIKSIKDDVETIRTSTARSAHDTFIERLTELVPDWQDVNVDPAFHAFLAEVDPMFGEERQVGLSRAQGAHDATRAARFFDAFKGASQTRAVAADAKMNSQVVPDTRAQGNLPRGKVIFTRNEIAKFYADWRSGRISDADAVAKEAEINLAISERRIR